MIVVVLAVSMCEAGAKFSHGYCPDCAEKEMEALRNSIPGG